MIDHLCAFAARENIAIDAIRRCGPSLAAMLEEAGAPVDVIESADGGHDVSVDVSHPDLLADRMTFLND